MKYRDYERVKLLDDTCKMLGFEVGRSTNDFSDNASVFLKVVEDGDQLPVYTRGTALFGGTVEECLSFLQGWMRSSDYHKMLLNKRPEDIKKAEQKYIAKLELARQKIEHERLMHILKTGEDVKKMTTL
jgi:hypothetical protein